MVEEFFPIHSFFRINHKDLLEEIFKSKFQVYFFSNFLSLRFNIFEYFSWRHALKRSSTFKHFIENTSDAPNVWFGIVEIFTVIEKIVGQKLRRWIERASHLSVGHFKPFFGTSKVANQNSILVQQNVGTLKISMYHLMLPKHLESFFNLLEYF